MLWMQRREKIPCARLFHRLSFSFTDVIFHFMILLHYREDTIVFISFSKYHFIWCELCGEKKFTEKNSCRGGQLGACVTGSEKFWHSAVINFEVTRHRGRQTNSALSYLKFADVLFARVSRIIFPHFSEKLSTAFLYKFPRKTNKRWP